jgi:hypothetical protein
MLDLVLFPLVGLVIAAPAFITVALSRTYERRLSALPRQERPRPPARRDA